MVSAAILLLPLAGCLAALVMRLQKIRLAYVWLALVSGVLLSWVIILLISPDTPIIFTLRNFLSLYGPELEFSIGVSNANWPILIFISSTMATYLMTDITSPLPPPDPAVRPGVRGRPPLRPSHTLGHPFNRRRLPPLESYHRAGISAMEKSGRLRIHWDTRK